MFAFAPAGLLDEDDFVSTSEKLVYPYPFSPREEAARTGEELRFYLEATTCRDASIVCPIRPGHRLQFRFRNAEAEACGGRRLIEFVADGGAGYFALSAHTAARLARSGLTGFELFPTELDLSQYRYQVPDAVVGINCVGRPCQRIGSVVGDNRCTQCGQPDLFCSQCGHWFFRCPQCKAAVQCVIHNEAVDGLGGMDAREAIRYDTRFLLDGDRYDGSDFIGTAGGQFISARAIEWLVENGVRGFSARHCLLAIR